MAELPRRIIYAVWPFLFMEDIMSNPKSKYSGMLIKKTLAVILVGVFLFTNTLSWRN